MCIRDSTNLIPQIIKNQFKKYNITVTFKTNNNIQNVLRTKRNKNPETCSGIYKIVCDDCDKFYIGQTGRGFKDRYIAVSYTHLRCLLNVQ